MGESQSPSSCSVFGDTLDTRKSALLGKQGMKG